MPKEMVTKRRRHKGMIDNDRTIPQRNIKKTNRAKIELLEEYYNFNSMKLIPITKETLDRLAENGERWAMNNPKAYKVAQFCIEQGIPERTWDRWQMVSPRLKEANDNMNMIIGCRREEGLIERRFDSGSTMFMMPHYDSNWKRMCEWRASLKPKEGEGKGSETFVVIEKYPNSALVPEKKDEE
jgi:hypothetical protein